MDKFTKYALLIMVASVAAMIIATYVGVYVYGGNMETKYVTMIEEEAEALGLNFGHLVELGETGEYIGFSLAGAICGFIIGYLIPSVFEDGKQPLKEGGEKHA
ncbi:MAG: hypothetical protein ACPLKQ_01010 [Candidatus Bathyarchaeales archaeon]